MQSSSDVELMLPSEAEQSQSPRQSSRWGIVAAAGVVGMLSLTVCVALMAQGNRGVSPRMLLTSPDVANLVTEHHMQMLRNFHQPAGIEQETKTRADVAAKLQKHNAELHRRSPKFASFLDSTVLAEEEKAGVLHLMKHVGDRRVQQIGQDFARAKLASKSMDKAAQRRYIVEKFRPRLAEIRRLHADIFGGLPASMASLGRRDLDSLLKDTPQKRRLSDVPLATPVTAALAVPAVPAVAPAVPAATVVNGVVVPAMGVSVTTAPDYLAEGKGLLEEFEEAITAFKAMFEDQIKNMNIPILSDLLAASDDLTEEAECALDAGENYEETQEVPMEQMMTCPLKLGQNGMAQISALLKDLGVENPCDMGIGNDC